MTVLLRPPLESDARHVASLLSQLGYPSDEADVRIRLRRFLDREDCFFRVAHSADRVTSLVVSEQNRSRGIGEQLLAAAAIFASEHQCSGLEITSAQHRLDAHRFYERLGFSRTSVRFFRSL
jgi:GNAT superfamily N-acetyltransferase